MFDPLAYQLFAHGVVRDENRARCSSFALSSTTTSSISSSLTEHWFIEVRTRIRIAYAYATPAARAISSADHSGGCRRRDRHLPGSRRPGAR